MKKTKNGILLLEKPENISSNKCIQIIKKNENVKKIGHCGTLDPFAGGLLIALTNKATKLSNYITNQSKKYKTTFTLGIQKDTDDIEGETVEKSDLIVDINRIKKTIRNFIGKVQQEPPQFSAIKKAGKKSYEQARKGIKIIHEKRNIQIYNIDIIKYNYPYLELDVHCSKGTYIRSLARDIGIKLGTYAFVSKLYRYAIEDFNTNDEKLVNADLVNKIKNNELQNLKGKYISLYEFANLYNNEIGILEIKEKYIDYIKKGMSLKNFCLDLSTPSNIKKINIVFDNNKNELCMINHDLSYICVFL